MTDRHHKIDGSCEHGEGSKGVVEARGVGPGKTGWKRQWVLGHMGGGG